MSQKSGVARIRWVDLIRAVGAYLVVVAHVQYSGGGTAWAGWFYYSLSRVAVPLFFMVSGYLLLTKSEPISEFFKRRLIRVFLPFFAWSVIYLVWKREGFDLPGMDLAKSYLVRILRGPRESHLWFFYELFGLYLFTHILRVYVRRASRSDLMFFCGLWFLMIPIANLVQEFTPLKIGFSYQFLGGYIGYFIFGYLAGTTDFQKRPRAIALLVFLLFLAFTVIGIYVRGILGVRTQYFEDYQSFNVVLMSASLFICLVTLEIGDLPNRLLHPISLASFGIYLVHVIVMVELFSKPPLSVLISSGSGIYMIPLVGLIGFTVSFVVIFIIQRIPALRYLAP